MDPKWRCISWPKNEDIPASYVSLPEGSYFIPFFVGLNPPRKPPATRLLASITTVMVPWAVNKSYAAVNGSQVEQQKYRGIMDNLCVYIYIIVFMTLRVPSVGELGPKNGRDE